MKILFILPLLGLWVSIASSGDFEYEITALLDKQAAAWNEGNIDTFMQTYWKSDSLQFLSAAGPTYGWQNTLTNYHQRYPSRASMGELRFEVLQITQHSRRSCTLIGTYHLDRDGMENKSGHFLLVIRKIAGQWLIVADSTH